MRANINIKPEWALSERECTPESLYLDRRTFLKKAGASLAATALLACNKKLPLTKRPENPIKQYDASFAQSSFPAQRNLSFKAVAERQLTPEILAATYNNYYEFTQEKELVWRLAGRFNTRPWSIEVGGLVKKPRRYDLEALLRRFSPEERVYRFRCVEAWSMVVPWTGIAFQKLIRFFEPLSKARYVRFIGWRRPTEAPGQVTSNYDWPYYEGLRMDEANNELTLFTVGMYGHPLHKQNGAPVRLIVPWKYGYKSMKGITRIEFVEKQPPTFWNNAAPSEYGFYSNVNPNVPHPRWSQAREQLLGMTGKVNTLAYNGYGNLAAQMYTGKEF